MTPVMAVRMRQVQISAILRVSLSPVLDDLPFIGGISLSLMAQPCIDFDLRQGLPQDHVHTPASSQELRMMSQILADLSLVFILCRLVAGPDIMSVPALSSYLQASLMEVFIDQMIW